MAERKRILEASQDKITRLELKLKNEEGRVEQLQNAIIDLNKRIEDERASVITIQGSKETLEKELHLKDLDKEDRISGRRCHRPVVQGPRCWRYRQTGYCAHPRARRPVLPPETPAGRQRDAGRSSCP